MFSTFERSINMDIWKLFKILSYLSEKSTGNLVAICKWLCKNQANNSSMNLRVFFYKRFWELRHGIKEIETLCRSDIAFIGIKNRPNPFRRFLRLFVLSNHLMTICFYNFDEKHQACPSNFGTFFWNKASSFQNYVWKFWMF